MSNQFCQLLAPNYDYPNLSKDSSERGVEDIPAAVNVTAAYNQQQILEQLLLALTNQLAFQASQNINTKNLNQHFSAAQSIFNSEQLSFNDRNNNEKAYENEPVPQTNSYDRITGVAANSLNKINSDYEFPQTNRSSEADEEEERETETEEEDDEEEDEEIATCNKNQPPNNPAKTGVLINVESFNLDTHLDLERYMYFSQTEQNLLTTQTTNSEESLSVDCRMPSSASCQLSSSSNSSSNSSISNLCKATLNTATSNSTKTVLSTAESTNTTNQMHPTSQLLGSQQPKRPVSYLSQLSGYLSSSSDCLSGDEGYFGSYSDTKNLSQQKLHQPQNPHQQHQQQINHQAESISQQEQVILLKYLLQSQHITQLNSIQSAEAACSATGCGQKDSVDSFEIPCLNIFNSTQDQEDNKFTSLLLSSAADLSDSSSDKFDVINLLSTSEKNFRLTTRHTDADTLYSRNGLRLKEEILEILTRQETERAERERLEEIEMRTLNWRRLLEQRARIEQYQRELSQEDHIDCNAYLNEIEMNLDHFQSYDFSALNSQSDEDILIDTLLRFRTNRMAFNLRNYHRSIELDKERRRLVKEDLENRKKQNMFANFHVDSIPEFTPYATLPDPYPYDQYDINADPASTDEHLLDLVDLDEMLLLNNDYQQEQGLLDNDYTMVDDGNEPAVYDENGYLVTASVYDEADLVDAADSEYIYEEDYEDYEDQILVDSLSEQDALSLLRNESEMYALQMAQASKSGLLPKTKSQKKKKGRFDSGTSSTTTQSTDTASGDLFENVFSFDDVVRTTDSSCDLTSSAASVSGTTEGENMMGDGHEMEFDINEFFMPQVCLEQGNGKISNSLRNSLLQLRHTRRHLAKLIESKKGASLSGGSSTSGSMTNLNTPLGAQPTKQITISALSRKPCVYMLNEGRCMRADCRFAHDLKQITCKYWIDGECLKGDNCEFLHELIEEATPPSSKLAKQKAPKPIAIKKKDFKLDTEEFPALGGLPAPSSLPKAVEFPPLGASPVSIFATISQSPKESSVVVKAGTPPTTNVIKTAASVLKAIPAVAASPVAVANLVSNKAQQQPLATSKPLKAASSANLSQKQRKQQLQQQQQNSLNKLNGVKSQQVNGVCQKKPSSCASSSASSSCSSISSGNKL